VKVADFYAKGYYAGLAPEPRFDAVLKIASSIRGGRLLDIGCGDGTFTLQLKEALGAEEVVGVEVSAEAVLAARKQGMEACQLDVSEQSLPFEDSCLQPRPSAG
jgi:predicted RNA methylase